MRIAFAIFALWMGGLWFSGLHAAELTAAIVANQKGDGPDGKGNTADDSWQFWFALAHEPQKFHRLSTHSATVPAKGISGKVRGPIASLLPNPKQSSGWIYHRDWDGRFEGVWGDTKANRVLVHPYVEKNAHLAVAVSYRIPNRGVYALDLKVSDAQLAKGSPHDGITWIVQAIAPDQSKIVELAKGGPLGDGRQDPKNGTFKAARTIFPKDTLVRLIIHPNKWWGQDLTLIESFKVTLAPPKEK